MGASTRRGTKYILQFKLEELVEAQKSGVPIESDIPSTVGDVRSISIRLGTGQLPQQDLPVKSELKFPTSDQENRKPETSAQTGPNAKQRNSSSQPLLQSGQGKPLTAQTGNNEPAEASKTAQESKSAAAPAIIGELTKPWTLVWVSIILFASLAANIYMLWIYAELRKRYRTLLVK